jgi:indolepyruvate ferredoxin oxidoreductase
VETIFGRKRRINQSSCNKDYSCVKGYCPSFVSVIGGRVRKAAGEASRIDEDALFADLPTPQTPSTSQPYNVLVAGIGGSGVVTVGAILAMAAHLERKGCSELDVTGLAQKNGPVTSHVRVCDDPQRLHATRIADAGADLVIGCDVVVTANAENLGKLAPGRSTAVVNDLVAPTSDFASNPDLDLSASAMLEAIEKGTGEKRCHALPATALATALLGDAIASNLFLLGYAFQLGCLPVSLPALERAIELNGRAVGMNRRAFSWGRLAAHDRKRVEETARPALREAPPEESLDDLLARGQELLTAYQGKRYARRYTQLVGRVGAAERAMRGTSGELARTVARYGLKLMAYKDEYEVARLYTDGSFQRQLEREFDGDFSLQIHLSPQFLPGWLVTRDPETGRLPKWTLGPWMFGALRLLARLRFLRGTPFDPVGWTTHRRAERRLIRDYEACVAQLLEGLSEDNHAIAVAIASLPEQIRGFDLVKDRSLEEVQQKQTELLASFRLRAPAATRESIA